MRISGDVFRTVSRAALASAALMAAASYALGAEYRIYTGNPVENGAVRGMKAAIQRIDKETNGDVQFKLLLGGQLQIQTNDITQAVSDDVLPIADDQSFTGTVPVGGILRLPGLIRTVDEYRTAHEIVRPYLDASYARYGIKVLGDFRFPPIVLWGRQDDLTSLESVSGKKIRVGSEVIGAFVEKFGGSPMTIQFNETATALDRGMVDGIATAAAGGGWALRDYLKSTYQIPLSYSNTYIIANDDFLASIGSDNAEKVARIFSEEMAAASEQTDKEEGEVLKKMQEGGVAVHQASAEEIARMQADMVAYWDQWASTRGADVVEALGKVRQALGR